MTAPYPPPAYYPPPSPQPAERSGRAVTALILGLVGIVLWFLGPIAIGFGVATLAGARGRMIRGRGMGVAGLVLGILETLGMVIVIAALVAGTSSPAVTPAGPAGEPLVSATASGSAATGTPGIGAKVRDGKFQFTVTSITHARTVGDPSGLSQTAQGEYTILHVTVTNIGSVPQVLDDSAQYVYDARGRQYTADSTADLYIRGNDVFFTTINPGNTVRGEIAFDLPPGDSAVRAVLHDSAFSGGVTVALS
jgi:Domain of unknown function (DUF4352)